MDPEDGGSVFLQYVYVNSTIYSDNLFEKIYRLLICGVSRLNALADTKTQVKKIRDLI
jgi:hypothetical protein